MMKSQFGKDKFGYLSTKKEIFEVVISGSIRKQLEDYRALLSLVQGAETVECICLIKMDISLNGITYRDQFECDINDTTIQPEVVARGIVADMVRAFFLFLSWVWVCNFFVLLFGQDFRGPKLQFIHIPDCFTQRYGPFVFL